MDTLAPEVLLAVLTAAVGIYVLLPEHRRLHLKLRMHRLDWVMLISSFLLVHYILFFPVLESVGLTVDLGNWRWGFTPALTSYLILGGAIAFVAVRTMRSKLSPSRIPALGRLLDELRYEERYSELFFVLEENLSGLAKAYQTNYWPVAIRRRLAPTVAEMHLSGLRQEEPLRLPPKSVRKLVGLLPTFSASQAGATDIVRRLMLSEEFAERVASTKPYLGVELLSQPFREREDFQDLWFQALLDNLRSVLYFEIDEVQRRPTVGAAGVPLPPSLPVPEHRRRDSVHQPARPRSP